MRRSRPGGPSTWRWIRSRPIRSAPSNAGDLVYSICSKTVDHVALVADAAIRDAQRLLWRDYRIASEPGGAAALAALISGAYKPRSGERIGVLLCGANVELAQACRDHPSVMEGRPCSRTV